MSGAAQTLLLLAAPFVLPNAAKLVLAFLNPKPAGTRTPLQLAATNKTQGAGPNTNTASDSRGYALWRLVVTCSAMSWAAFTALAKAPHNLFLQLAAPETYLQLAVPALRKPLDIRTSTDTLVRTLLARSRADLAQDDMALLGRLQTLEARVIYVACGRDALMNCSWCAPTSSTTKLSDYLALVVVDVAIEYLVVLVVFGSLLLGRRRRWRPWVTTALVAGACVELWTRSSWTPAATAAGQVVMIHSQCHLWRHVFFAVLFGACYVAPPKPRSNLPTTASMASPALSEITQKVQSTLQRVRAGSLQRMAMLHHHADRDKVVQFWSNAQMESIFARADPAVRSAIERGRQNDRLAELDDWLKDMLDDVDDDDDDEEPKVTRGGVGDDASGKTKKQSTT